MNLEQNFHQLKTEAYAGLQKRQSSKSWIRMLEVLPYYLTNLTRGRLLQAVNIGMRILDDYADGDKEVPFGQTPVDYLEAKQQFILNPKKPKDELDYLFTYCYQLAEKSGLNIQRELNAFFDYFIFDAKRLGTGQIFPEAELNQAYDSCDIEGTIRGSLMVFGDDPERANLLMPLGRATRKFYTLRDYDADIKAGFVNIPQEAIDKFQIDPNDLANKNSHGVRSWFEQEAVQGLVLVSQHQQMLQQEKFGLRGKVALDLAYTKPTTEYLERMLAGKTLHS